MLCLGVQPADATYNAARVTQTQYPDGSQQRIVYRPDGRKASETDPRGTTTSYGYDATGRLTSVSQSGITTATAYAYDQTGAKTTQTDALGRAVRWVYDRAGRPLSRTLPDGAQETFQYDGEGNLSTHTDFGGHSTQYTYDTQGRPLTRITLATVAAPARTTTWTYSADGQRATQTESGDATAQGTTTYSYDALGRLIGLQTPQGDLAWTYDPAGRITERSTAEGTTRYGYDGDGRLQVLTAPDGRTTSYTYDAAGRNTRSEQQLDGIDKLVTERRYDAADRQVTIAHSKQSAGGTTLIAGQAITRGPGGAVTRIDSFDSSASFDATTATFTGNPSRVQTFAYDANARLIAERDYQGTQLTTWLTDPTRPASQAIAYAYDPVGNRTTKTRSTPTATESTATESTTYAYDSNDRLTTETLTTASGGTITTTYTWDGNGNLHSQQTPTTYTGYTFDGANRLIAVERGSSPATATSIAHYAYDADGQRIRKDTPAGTTHYLIDPTTPWPQVVLEQTVTPTGTQATAYVWGDQLRQQIKGSAGTLATAPGETLIPLPGHLDTPLAAIDQSGNVVERYETNAFGELANPHPRANHQYTGEYWDADAQLTYLRARWQEPKTGRLLSLDPAKG